MLKYFYHFHVFNVTILGPQNDLLVLINTWLKMLCGRKSMNTNINTIYIYTWKTKILQMRNVFVMLFKPTSVIRFSSNNFEDKFTNLTKTPQCGFYTSEFITSWLLEHKTDQKIVNNLYSLLKNISNTLGINFMTSQNKHRKYKYHSRCGQTISHVSMIKFLISCVPSTVCTVQQNLVTVNNISNIYLSV